MKYRLLAVCLLPLCVLLMAGSDEVPPGESPGTSRELTEPHKVDASALEKDAEAGNAAAQFDLGRRYQTGNGVAKDAVKAVEWYQKAAAQGVAEAQFKLGGIYYAGQGVPQDYKKAAAWYEKAAAQGFADAQFILGVMYHAGQGVPQDYNKAAAWYVKAAAQGFANAQFILGSMYDTGQGVPTDKKKAAAWFEKAAVQGFAAAQSSLGVMYNAGEGVPKDQKKAATWYEKAATQGFALAQFNLGVMYYSGQGVPKDQKKAAIWFEKAAAQGFAAAQFILGAMYHAGQGLPQDYKKAAAWYEKAAAQGVAEAQFNLGLMYDTGKGVPQDYKMAAAWYQKAAAQGHAGAQLNIGDSYGTGEGVPKDYVLADAWFNLAASQAVEDFSDKASKNRAIVEQTMSTKQIAEAQRLSLTWQRGQLLHREAEGGNATTAPDQPSPGDALKKTGTGTLFVVNMQGQSITNAAVVKDCAEVRIENQDGLATVTVTDPVNDLALIQIPGAVSAVAPIAKEPDKLRQGDEIVEFGFPLNTILSSGGNLTPGVVSAVTGIGDNTNQIQIIAPIQPGSTGSLVLNKKGEVVGVVSMKLSAAKMAAATGSIGQNVNFAVNGQTLKAFLDAHEVNYKNGAGDFSVEKPLAELADDARKWTRVVECWR